VKEASCKLPDQDTFDMEDGAKTVPKLIKASAEKKVPIEFELEFNEDAAMFVYADIKYSENEDSDEEVGTDFADEDESSTTLGKKKKKELPRRRPKVI
jgi:hypothetical protein